MAKTHTKTSRKATAKHAHDTGLTPQALHDMLKKAGLHPPQKPKFQHLGQGENNENFVVKLKKDHYVLRIGKDQPKAFARMHREADTLRHLPAGIGPELVYFDDSGKLVPRPWLVETYIAGSHVKTWTKKDLAEFGRSLNWLHAVQSSEASLHAHRYTRLNYWQFVIDCNEHFYNRNELDNFPDGEIASLLKAAYKYCTTLQPLLDDVKTFSLIHGDLANLNILKTKQGFRLIDWEFADFYDPARDFATFFYDDMTYNAGQWRVRLDSREEYLLLMAYGDTTEEFRRRVNTWIQLDKLNALLYLAWKERRNLPLTASHHRDVHNLVESLTKRFSGYFV